MKTIKIYVRDFNEDQFTINYKYKRDLNKAEAKLEADKCIAEVKAEYPKAKIVEALIPVKAKLDKRALEEVGHAVASGWGAQCLGFETYETLVNFKCIEFGDRFETTLTYDEIKEDYDYIIKRYSK